MLKRLGYYVFIGALSAAAILLAVMFIPGLNNGFAILLEQIFNTCKNQISEAVALTIPFVVFVLCSANGLIYCLIAKPKQAQVEEKKKSAIFYFFFFFSFGVSSLLLIPLCMLFVFNPFHFCYQFGRIFFIPSVYVGCLALALIQAVLQMRGASMWKVNKTKSFLFFGLVAVSLFACVLPGLVGHKIADKGTYSDRYYNGADSRIAEAASYEGDGGEEPTEPVLSNLWESTEYGSDSVGLAIELFSKRLAGMNNSYYSILQLWRYIYVSRIEFLYDEEEAELWPDESEYHQAFKNFNKIADYLLANKDLLYTAYSKYSYLLYNLVSNKTYYKSGASELMTYLRKVHNDLYDNDDTNTRLYEIYRQMTRVKYDDISDYYDDIKAYTTDKDLVEFAYRDDDLTKADDDLKKAMAVWAYSFWARRHHEETDDATYDILNEIISHYEDYD